MFDGEESGCDCGGSNEREVLDMKKVINPCMCEVYNGRARGFVKIEYDDGRLSLCGVIGPMSNGNAKGSCGQCIDEIREGEPTEGWTREMLDKLCQIWDRWHLNDMNPCCEHQRELGWLEKARENVTLYHFRLKREVCDAQKEAEKAAIAALKAGKPFYPTKEQTRVANLAYSIVTSDAYAPEEYEPKKPLYSGDTGPTETKALGWLRPEEHPEGLLCRPCPVCGYKYGTSWKNEEVPQKVIDWLFSLPDTRVKPAWV